MVDAYLQHVSCVLLIRACISLIHYYLLPKTLNYILQISVFLIRRCLATHDMIGNNKTWVRKLNLITAYRLSSGLETPLSIQLCHV